MASLAKNEFSSNNVALFRKWVAHFHFLSFVPLFSHPNKTISVISVWISNKYIYKRIITYIYIYLLCKCWAWQSCHVRRTRDGIEIPLIGLTLTMWFCSFCRGICSERQRRDQREFAAVFNRGVDPNFHFLTAFCYWPWCWLNNIKQWFFSMPMSRSPTIHS